MPSLITSLMTGMFVIINCSSCHIRYTHTHPPTHTLYTHTHTHTVWMKAAVRVLRVAVSTLVECGAALSVNRDWLSPWQSSCSIRPPARKTRNKVLVQWNADQQNHNGIARYNIIIIIIAKLALIIKYKPITL